MRSLFERYAPETWDDLIGHPQVKRAVAAMKKSGGLGGRVFYVSGPSGVGKSSIARLIAREVADEWNIQFIDAGPLTTTRVLNIEESLATYGIGEKNGRAVIVNEVHALRADALRQMLTCFEDGRVKNHCCWILTTTSAGQQMLLDGIDADPLLSRCVCWKLEAFRYINEFAKRAQEIAEAEGLGGAEFSEYVALAKRVKCNFRALLSAIEAGELLGDLVLA